MSCLFNVLARYLTSKDESNKQATGSEVRKLICETLKTDPMLTRENRASELIKWETDFSLQKYIEEMEKSQTWGGTIEILTFANIYRCKVNILYDNHPNFSFESILPHKGEINIKYTGNHYYL